MRPFRSSNSGLASDGSSGINSGLPTAILLPAYTVNFSWIVLHITRYVNRLALVPTQAQTAARMRLRICQLLEVLLQKRTLVGIRQDVLFRNHMVEVLLEWNSEFGIKTGEQLFVAPQDPANRLSAELDQTTMRVMVALLQGLPLVGVAESNGVLSEIRDDEDGTVKSRIFSTYLTFFLKVLQTCKLVESLDSSNRQPSTPEARAIMSKSKESIQHLTVLKDDTILALSNLIGANIRAGLKYSLSIAYHEDPRTRSAFMYVITRILEGGSVSGLLGDDWQESKYAKLLELITDDDLAIVLTLCEVTSSNDIDEIASALLSVFEQCGKASALITTVIADEIQRTDTAASIFRRNSIATKLLALYAKSEGQDFLQVTLMPIIRALSEAVPPATFEIDPSRIDAGEDIQLNMQNLKSVVQDFLNSIFGNASRFPAKLRRICANVVDAVSRKFPNAGLLGVGAFVFLRFICPAIVAPESHGLLKQPVQQRDVRRGLILVTKVIQNLANAVLFGNKEAFMIGLNDLLDVNQAAVSAFLMDISTTASADRSLDDHFIGVHTEDLPVHLAQLHKHLEAYLPRMERAVASAVAETQLVPNVSRFATLRGSALFVRAADAGGKTVDPALAAASGADLMPPPPLSASPGAAADGASAFAAAATSALPPPIAATIKRKSGVDQLSVLLVQLGPAASFPRQTLSGPAGPRGTPGQASSVAPSASGSLVAGSNGSAVGGAAGVAAAGSLAGVGSKEAAALRSAASSRGFIEFMGRQAALPTKQAVADFVRDQRIFYESGTSLDGRPVFYYIARKVVPDSIDMDMLLHVFFETAQPHLAKPFDLVVDLTFLGPPNEWAPETLHMFEKVSPPDMRNNIHTVMFLHPNSFFKGVAKRASRLLHSRMAKRIVFASTVNELHQFVAADKLTLPRTTTSMYDQPLTVFTPVNVHPYKGSSLAVTLSLSTETIHVLMNKKQDVMGLQPPIVDIFRIADIRDAGPSSLDPRNADTEFFVKLHERHASASAPEASGASAVSGASGSHGSSTMARSSGAAIVYFSSPRREAILQGIRAAVARFQLSKPPMTSDERDISPRDLPGTLLNIALLNLGSNESSLRVASYDLLCAIMDNFAFNSGVQLQSTKGIAIPFNNQRFVVNISRQLAKSQESLTFEFLSEGLLGYPKLSRELKHHMLEYLSPWWANLAQYVKPADTIANALQAEASRQKLGQILTSLLQMTIKEQENFAVIQEQVWAVLGKEESLVPVILDLFLETATQLPAGAKETEILGNTLVTVAIASPLVVPGLVIKALRDALALTSTNPRPSVVDHPAWRQVQAVLRFLLMLSFDNKLRIQHTLADLFHSLTLVAGLGVPFVRRTVHGIVLNTVQVLSTAAGLSETGLAGLQIALDKLYDPKYARVFGLSPATSTGATGPAMPGALASAAVSASGPTGQTAYGHSDRQPGYITPAFVVSNETIKGESIKELSLSEVEFFVGALMDLVTYGAPSLEACATWKTRWISLAARSAFEDNPTAQTRSFVTIGLLARDGFDGDLLYQTLIALRSSLLRFDDTRPQLVQSVVMCLCSSLHSAPAHDSIIVPLFWLSIGLVQIGFIPFFLSGLNLMQVVLRLVEENPSLRGSQLTNLLLSGRERLREGAIKLDHETLIYFGEFFSFSVSATLLKGLSNQTLRAPTTAVLTSFIELTSHVGVDGSVDPHDFCRHTLGYLLPLLPSSENPEALLALAGVMGRVDGISSSTSSSAIEEPMAAYKLSMPNAKIPAAGGQPQLPRSNHQPQLQAQQPQSLLNSSQSLVARRGAAARLASRQWTDHLTSAISMADAPALTLVLALLQVMLEASDSEPKILQIHRLFVSLAEQSPVAFAPVYRSLIPRFSAILLSTKSPQLSETVHAIFESMAALSTSTAVDEDMPDAVNRLGFAGLFSVLSQDSSAVKDSKHRRVAALCQMIDLIVKTGAL
ncbi:hypothetical protein BC831DRAFT_92159 [Entophlyctis helioformis]|nr:hypothetical protein BC831DRAFT_92159 [Entophlyctis helioformis]